MNRTRRLFNFVLGSLTCLLLISFSIPSLGKTLTSIGLRNNPDIFSASELTQIASAQTLINQHLDSNWQAAESVLVAQGMMESSTMKRYRVMLTRDKVVGSAPMTSAFGTAGAVLVGNRLVLRGDFSGLSSALRDYGTDPVSPPNPNITSAVHIHRGATTENGPFQYALKVMLNQGGLSGRFAGEYTLSDEQLQALEGGKLYMDIHTKQNRAGELRGLLQAV
ncbi:CHRD domain-containing protein [Leptolyngbya sp. 'hensonii']|uniref:CHRD domain-containing protein n=1 Tax=Leptolyngbya sp. 'hensonii' TaxID=1922337 RepID=UPI00094FE8BF|nr:CHRD domain-containing protein [Leptolyngbya sp. 'hensonii']OLP16541.1 CHRD domain-containing protein [Leptolyngbya sp. 'hensonii']